MLKDLSFYERAREVDGKARQEHLDQREEKRQEGTLRKAPGEKGRSSSPVVRPPATKEKKKKKKKKKKKTKKTIVQALQVVSPTPDLSSSSCRFEPSLSYNPASEPEETSGSPQLEPFRPGPSSSQPQSDFFGLRVTHELEEVRDMNNLRVELLQRHRKRLYDLIDLEPPSAKKTCAKRGGEGLMSATTLPDEASPSATAATQSEAIGSGAAATVQADAPGPSSMAAAQSSTTAFGDAPAVVETRGSEGVPDASIDEEAPRMLKGSLAVGVPPSWEEMMKMLKGVPCFTDAEAPSTRMSDFFPLTKRVSVNIGSDPPAFIKAQLPFGTP